MITSNDIQTLKASEYAMPMNTAILANIAMSAITAIPANPAVPTNTVMRMFLTSCETEITFGNLAESELLCV